MEALSVLVLFPGIGEDFAGPSHQERLIRNCRRNRRIEPETMALQPSLGYYTLSGLSRWLSFDPFCFQCTVRVSVENWAL